MWRHNWLRFFNREVIRAITGYARRKIVDKATFFKLLFFNKVLGLILDSHSNFFNRFLFRFIADQSLIDLSLPISTEIRFSILKYLLVDELFVFRAKLDLFCFKFTEFRAPQHNREHSSFTYPTLFGVMFKGMPVLTARHLKLKPKHSCKNQMSLHLVRSHSKFIWENTRQSLL